MFTRKQIHDKATAFRKNLEDIWFDNTLVTPKAQLFAKCAGLVYGDRVEVRAFSTYMKSGVVEGCE